MCTVLIQVSVSLGGGLIERKAVFHAGQGRNAEKDRRGLGLCPLLIHGTAMSTRLNPTNLHKLLVVSIWALL